jgi:menaquinone-dependent protoporphyrinogen IX oxidase
MRVLIVYYSRTGLTKKIATLISTKIKSDLDEITDKKKRTGPMRYIIAGRDAMKKRLTGILYERDPKDYDLILIGGPVWAWAVTPAIRTYLDKNADALKIKKLAFFATQGSSGAEKKFEAMEEILGMKPFATLIINGKDFRDNTYTEKTDKFMMDIDRAAKS